MHHPNPENLDDFLTESHPPPSGPLTRKWLNHLYRALWRHRYRGSLNWKSLPHSAFIRATETNAAFEAHELKYSTGIVITTWNRPQYLQPCLDSLSRSDLTDALVIIVDDASDDAHAIDIIGNYDLPVPLIKIYKKEQTLMHVGLDIGWCLSRNLGCHYLSNLDADAIVRTDWLARLKSLFETLPYDPDNTLLSGFNRSNSPCVLEEHDDYRLKYRMGGINYFFTPAFYSQVRHLMFNSNWDSHIQYFCGTEHANKYHMVCCKPSVVQHIGQVGLNSSANSDFDTATDFVAD